MLLIFLIKRILQEFLSSIDDQDRLLYIFVSIKNFTLVCKQWRASVVPQLSFETPINSALRNQPNHRINYLLNIGFRNFNVKSSYFDFETLGKADEEEEKRPKGGFWRRLLFSSGEKRVQTKRLDQLKAFRDNTTILFINFENIFASLDLISDYIDPRRLKILYLFNCSSISLHNFNVDEYFRKNSFHELRDLLIQYNGVLKIDWSFPTMLQLESLDILSDHLSGEEIDIIFGRVKVITMRYIDILSVLGHLERSTVVCDFNIMVKIVPGPEQLFQQLFRLLNTNNTLKSLNIQYHRHMDLDLRLFSPLPLIHNTTLESLSLPCYSVNDNWTYTFTIFFSKWIGSNLKTFYTPHRPYFTFNSELAQGIQSSYPKLEKISFHAGDINAFKSYVLSNHNLKTIIFNINTHLNSSIIGCLHSVRDLTFYNISADLLIQILSMQSPSLKSISVKNPLESPSFLETIESLALSIRDNRHLTHLSFKTPTPGFSNDTQFIRFLTPIIEGNRSLLSLEIGYSLFNKTRPLDPAQSNLFKQSIFSNHTIRILKIFLFSNQRRVDLSPTMATLVSFIKSQSIHTNE